MSENAQLLSRICELKHMIEERHEEENRARHISAEQEQYRRDLISYQDYQIRAQAVQIELQEAKIQDMIEKHARHCEDMRRQMAFLGGIAFGRDGTPAVKESVAYPHWEFPAEVDHRAEFKLAPGDAARSGYQIPRNLPRNLHHQSSYEHIPMASLSSPIFPPSSPLGSWSLSKHDTELLQQIGLNIFSECFEETSAQEPQRTSLQPNDWLYTQEQSSEGSLGVGDVPRSVASPHLAKGLEHATEEATQGCKSGVHPVTHRYHRWIQPAEDRPYVRKFSGGVEKPKPQRRKGNWEIPSKEKLDAPPYQTRAGRG